MRYLIALAILIGSILIFGWWGLISIILGLVIIGWPDRYNGPNLIRKRWSLTFSHHGNLRYELTHSRALVLLGHLTDTFFKKKYLKEGWEIQIVSNQNGHGIKLSDKYFLNPSMPDGSLLKLLDLIDTDHSSYGDPQSEPLFYSVNPFERLPLTSGLMVGSHNMSTKDMAKHFEKEFKDLVENRNKEKKKNYFDVLREVFQD